jgi:16S rRNA processing protein RimM
MSSTSEGPEVVPEVIVGRIGKAHGVKGEVSVEPRTDEPERRFAVGAVLAVRTPRGAEPHAADRPATVTVRRTRWHQSRLLVTFEGFEDRTAAETLRGLSLALDLDPAEVPEDPEEFYDHQLVGLAAFTTDGDAVGQVTDVIHGASQDLLAVRTVDGREVLVPFVSPLVPVVDVPGRRLEIADRPGLITPLDEDQA